MSMSLERNPGVEDHDGKKVVMTLKAKDEEANDGPEQKPEPRFKPKAGSVFPKRRRSVKGLMLDYVRLQLGPTFSGTCKLDNIKNHSSGCCAFNTSTASSAALFHLEEASKAKRVYPHVHMQQHGSE